MSARPADGSGCARADRRDLGARLIRRAVAGRVALALALPAQAVYAQDPERGPSPQREAARIIAAELTMSRASAELDALNAQQPSSLLDEMRLELPKDRAAYGFRNPARQEELRLYERPSDAGVQNAVIPLLPTNLPGSTRH